MTLGVSYDLPSGQINFYVDDKVAYSIVIRFPVRWEGMMRAGKSSILEYEPFLGEISEVFIYDRPLIVESSRLMELAISSIAAVCAVQSPPSEPPDYSDANYRMCLTKCETVSIGRSQRLEDNYRPSAPVIELECEDSLDTREDLSGVMGTVRI
eukprot:Gregarina_sp_Poly_1__2421@NODE_164_length_12220_cov_166_864807_g146_i0_p8_GENE_NODE_164_length_12220_cov_166_864807_g146_i0NODE_164_length_12220_cov_166_864807_g146_i0_p8_ORF_typecomplete_len154_score18_48Laminin_G_3/PF13385_6/0_0032Pentaxin/PF00354_17/0_48_NODE_164_length_12220_cov_166_864807_g146_i01014810609